MTPLQTGRQLELEHAAAETIAASLRRAQQQRQRVSLALPGGRSVGGVLRCLLEQDIAWQHVVVLPADERCLPQGHSERNWQIVQSELLQQLIDRGALPAQNCHPFIYLPHLPDWGLADFGRSLDLPRTRDDTALIDVVVLGAGEDGHIASLFPGSPLLHSTDGDFLQVADSPKPPPRRITLSPAMIRSCGAAVVLFFGETKRGAARAFADHSVPVHACPAKLVHAVEHAWAFADRRASPARPG